MNFRYEQFKFKLDTKSLLFVAISGAHSYGTQRPDSDLDVRCVRFPPLEWALALSRSEKGIHKKTQGNVDIVTHNVYHFINVLLHGNGTFLENCFQAHLWRSEGLPKLQLLIRKYGLSKRMGGHYFGFMSSSLKDYARKKYIKNLLYCYRVAMTGIHLFVTGEIVYNLQELLDIKQEGTWDDVIDHWKVIEALPDNIVSNVESLLDLYHTETDLIMPNHSLMAEHDGISRELDCLRRIFGRYDIQRSRGGRPARYKEKRVFKLSSFIKDSSFPEAPQYAPFNNWLRGEMLGNVRGRHE